MLKRVFGEYEFTKYVVRSHPLMHAFSLAKGLRLILNLVQGIPDKDSREYLQ